MNFTTQELVILMILIIAIGGVLSFIFKSAIKIILAGVLICTLWVVGFEWLPEQIERIQNEETTPVEVLTDLKNTIVDNYESSGAANAVNEIVDTSGQWIEENKDSWMDSFKSLVQKLTGQYEEPEINNGIENNTILEESA